MVTAKKVPAKVAPVKRRTPKPKVEKAEVEVKAAPPKNQTTADKVIDLINQAQIFRFLNKPVSVRLLKGHVHAALQRYLTYKQAPILVDAHRVQRSEQVRESSVGRRILDGIKSLRGKWFGQG